MEGRGSFSLTVPVVTMVWTRKAESPEAVRPLKKSQWEQKRKKLESNCVEEAPSADSARDVARIRHRQTEEQAQQRNCMETPWSTPTLWEFGTLVLVLYPVRLLDAVQSLKQGLETNTVLQRRSEAALLHPDPHLLPQHLCETLAGVYKEARGIGKKKHHLFIWLKI